MRLGELPREREAGARERRDHEDAARKTLAQAGEERSDRDQLPDRGCMQPDRIAALRRRALRRGQLPEAAGERRPAPFRAGQMRADRGQHRGHRHAGPVRDTDERPRHAAVAPTAAAAASLTRASAASTAATAVPSSSTASGSPRTSATRPNGAGGRADRHDRQARRARELHDPGLRVVAWATWAVRHDGDQLAATIGTE